MTREELLALLDLGQMDQAVAELEKAVAASPSQPIFHNQLGVAYRENGQFAKAREAYERALSLDPNYAAPHLNLGILHDLYLWDGKRALDILHGTEHIDLLFTDMVMPNGVSGQDLILVAHQLRPAMKTILSAPDRSLPPRRH